MRALACLALTISVALLPGCGGSQPPIAAPGESLQLPLPPLDDTGTSPLTLKTCATTPPQYEWIFKGACEIFSVTSIGGHFSLGDYRSITVKGSIGRNTAKGTVQIALADAIDKNGDIKTYKGNDFPPFKANGITYFYASATNQSTQLVKPIMVKGEPVLQYTVTDANGFGDANRCGAALLTFRKDRKPAWTAFPTSGRVKGKTVTITQYAAPQGFELPPKIPVYFAANCYKK
jgi:hypothetical protein